MVLEIISVYFRRNKRLIFHNFNLKLAKSQIIILIGENGVGKSSLFDLSTGILKPEKGVIKINEIPINEIDQKKKDSVGRNAQRKVREKFSLKKMLNQTLQVYEELIDTQKNIDN